jgi:hypothetical protein
MRINVDAQLEVRQNIEEKLAVSYARLVGIEGDTGKLNGLIIDDLSDACEVDFAGQLDAFLAERPFLGSKLRLAREQTRIARYPVSILIYFLAFEAPSRLVRNRYLTADELIPFFADLGVSMPPMVR